MGIRGPGIVPVPNSQSEAAHNLCGISESPEKEKKKKITLDLMVLLS